MQLIRKMSAQTFEKEYSGVYHTIDVSNYPSQTPVYVYFNNDENRLCYSVYFPISNPQAELVYL